MELTTVFILVVNGIKAARSVYIFYKEVKEDITSDPLGSESTITSLRKEIAFLRKELETLRR